MKDRELRKAIALKYEGEGGRAPKVTAKGQGLIADEILSRAREAGVPVKEDASLAALLQSLEIHQEIPEDLYAVVAEIFAYIYKLDNLKEKN
ncbi:EscU/YscU/HrcU family type III secretion system export apparatus switch protein [Metabacillus sp. KIGAM252]|uniref:EscU/YscU/HrcU family type III secretion system export apparatus switch protein n=1 Tax=Metabacillus flavus TaxID=2823519 RepID=A0ABS5LDZ1_9BACI|nr:EscU/YscU/HrcU family type III secretion system export apparatus switch protein [Metabacillus flavus]MBS2968968.1 EscU/YscU/HrcU family type III secretion system export apparatus switch protein [Metabacillus flavus]